VVAGRSALTTTTLPAAGNGGDYPPGNAQRSSWETSRAAPVEADVAIAA
jgi:hypothetical protein